MKAKAMFGDNELPQGKAVHMERFGPSAWGPEVVLGAGIAALRRKVGPAA